MPIVRFKPVRISDKESRPINLRILVSCHEGIMRLKLSDYLSGIEKEFTRVAIESTLK